MQYILFPGRHHLVTRFQVAHLSRLLAERPAAKVVWAITSADHGGTQRNPIPGVRRLGLVEAVTTAASLESLTFLISNRQPKTDFAHYVIEEIRTQTGGAITMTPDNTLVACSTPEVSAGYVELGYAIDPVELGTTEARPWQIVEQIVANSVADREVSALLHPAALEYYLRYDLAGSIQQIYADPLIDSDDGDITQTRDYATYRAAFEDNAWRKLEEIAPLVQPGRILDVGCATGQAIKLLTERPALFESDFYGVEVARPLYEICQQRKSNGEFGDANVFFHQRNILTTRLFEPASLDTIISMALTHEVESYLGRAALIEFIEHMYSMLRPGGVWINYDVVGPAAGHEQVLAQFNTEDGAATGELSSLSSYARFKKFAQDFRHEEGDGISYSNVAHGGEEYLQLTRRDLYEFLAKKDYIDSWYSEAHEKFCFFTPADWAETLTAAGFTCGVESKPIQNPWLIEHRFAPAAKVWRIGSDGELARDDWSWTNVMLVARKPTAN